MTTNNKQNEDGLDEKIAERIYHALEYDNIVREILTPEEKNEIVEQIDIAGIKQTIRQHDNKINRERLMGEVKSSLSDFIDTDKHILVKMKAIFIDDLKEIIERILK